MPPAEAPLIDGRTYSDLVVEVETLIQQYTSGVDGPGWQPGKSDVGSALVRIFSRMAELVITRLNRLPDRNFLAFLDLIGVRLNPPQAARVPLTFLLAPGSPVDALVPAGTQAVAAALEGETEPPLFATERDLVVTRSQLVAVYTREPKKDKWADQTAVATGRTDKTFNPFVGDQSIVHRLYVSHPLFGLPEAKTITLGLGLADGSPSWPNIVDWTFWNGAVWKDLSPTSELSDGILHVSFSDATGFAASPVNGIDGFWLRGQAEKSFAPADPKPSVKLLQVQVTIDKQDSWTVPERSFANQAPLDLSKDALPFGEKPKIGDTFYLADEEALPKPDAVVELQIMLTDPDSTSQAASPDLMLTWEFWDGTARQWQILGNSGQGAMGSAGHSAYQFSDTTNGFLQEGSVQFTVPESLAMGEVNGEMRHWLRVRIAKGNYGVEAKYEPKDDEHGGKVYSLVPATFQPPSLRSVRLSYKYEYDSKNPPPPSVLPPPCVLTENDFSFNEVTNLPFTPFVSTIDEQPTLYLGFERPGDTAGFANRTTTLFFQVSEVPYGLTAESATVAEDAVAWEYWNGEKWTRLGISDETRGLTSTGLVTFIGPPDFKASTAFGRTAFWLRGRWKQDEYAHQPGLGRILTNTMWATHAQTIRGEVLGSSRGEPAGARSDRAGHSVGRRPQDLGGRGGRRCGNRRPRFRGPAFGGPRALA